MSKKIHEWIPAHKNAILLLKDDPNDHLETLSILYLYKTKVPTDDLPDLISAFEKAINKTRKCSLKLLGKGTLVVLNKQLKEGLGNIVDISA